MQPNYTASNHQSGGRHLRPLLLFVLVFILLVGGFLMYKNSRFHLIKTDPKLSAVSQYATGVTLYYNQALEKGSLDLYDPGAMIKTSMISGKTLKVTFSQSLQTGKQYEFVIRSIKSAGNSTLQNQTIDFTAQNIPFNKLNKALQNKIISNQDKYPYAVANINYTGFDSLIDQGVTSGEVQDIQTDIFNYSNTVKQQFWTVAVDASSLNIVFHDPADREADSSSATFNVTLGGNVFKVRSEYDGIADSTYTRIYDSTTGALVYDSSAQ